MKPATQMIFNITSITLTVAVIAGVVLMAIALFRIAHALKLRNQMLQQASRPYLWCQKNHQQLEIRNNSQIPATIDNIDSSSDFSQLNGKVIAAGQAFFYNLDGINELSLTINYHDQLHNYSDHFDI